MVQEKEYISNSAERGYVMRLLDIFKKNKRGKENVELWGQPVYGKLIM